MYALFCLHNHLFRPFIDLHGIKWNANHDENNDNNNNNNDNDNNNDDNNDNVGDNNDDNMDDNNDDNNDNKNNSNDNDQNCQSWTLRPKLDKMAQKGAWSPYFGPNGSEYVTF